MSIGTVLKTGSRAVVLAIAVGGCAWGANSGAQAITDTLQAAAAASEASGEYLVAADQYRKLLDRRPDDFEATLGLARNLRYSGRAREAVEVLDKAAGKSGDQVAFMVERGKANIAAGNLDEAIGFLVRARAKDDRDWSIHAALGIAYDLTEKFDEARQSYARALERSKGNPVVLNNMAISAALTGDIDRAIATLENAPQATRHSPQVRQNLALFYGIKGDMEKAEGLARMDLDEASVRNNMAVFSRLHANRTRPPAPQSK